jgi:hypothetical protein
MSSKTIDYIILKSSSIEGLQKKVIEYLEQDYETVGGVYVILGGNAFTSYSTYYQAVQIKKI